MAVHSSFVAKENLTKLHNGTTFLEISSIVSYAPMSCMLYFIIGLIFTAIEVSVGDRFFLENIILVLPGLLAITVLQGYSLLVDITMLVICIALLARKVFVLGDNLNHLKELQCEDQRKQFVFNFRAFMNIGTIMSILGVDFAVFPARLVKCEVYGKGLLDIGVGSFIFGHAVVSNLARGKTDHDRIKSRNVFHTISSSMPIIVLGMMRLLSVKASNYQESVTEYGVHWNFFFTLALVKIISELIMSVLPQFLLNHISLVGISLAALHQYLLSSCGISDYIIKGSKGDGSRSANIFDANREGIISCLGFIALYFIAVQIGKEIFKPLSKNVLLKRLAALDLFLWILTLSTEISIQKVSRRMCNGTYILWMLSLNVYLVAFFLVVEIFQDFIINPRGTKPPTNQKPLISPRRPLSGHSNRQDEAKNNTLNFYRNPLLVRAICFILVQYVICNAQEMAAEKPTKLTSKNFHDILSMDDPWVVVFLEEYTTEKEVELVAVANSVVGLVQIGFVDMDDPDCDELVEAKRITKAQIKVYDYGEENKETPRKAKNYQEALKMAMESYPDTFTRITDETIPAFYSKAVKESRPRKLPLIYFSEKDVVSPALRYLALNLKELFSFSILVNPSEELKKSFEITLLPQLTILFHLNLKTGAYEMIKYDRHAYGPPNFANLLKFLIGVQNEVGDKKHRKTLERLMSGSEPKSTPDLDKLGVQQMTSSSVSKICAPNSLALCVIAFLSADDEHDIKAKEKILDDVRRSKTLRDHHIRYSWINASCHQNIADAFDIDTTQLPIVIALKRSKMLFTNHVGSFSFDNLREFLLQVLSGKKIMTSYGKFPKFVTKDCKITKLRCKDGVCLNANVNQRKSNRGPKLSGGKRTEL
eukprot:gene7860-8710_t